MHQPLLSSVFKGFQFLILGHQPIYLFIFPADHCAKIQDLSVLLVDVGIQLLLFSLVVVIVSQVLRFALLEFHLDLLLLFFFLLDLLPELHNSLPGLLLRQQLFEFFAMGLDFVSVILANLTLGPASPEEAVVVADQ